MEFFHPALDILDEFSKKSIANLEKETQDFEIFIPLADTELSGLLAKEIYYNQKENNLELRSYCIWTLYEYRAYILCATGMQNDFKNYEPIFNEMINSFKIFEAENAPADYSQTNGF